MRTKNPTHRSAAVIVSLSLISMMMTITAQEEAKPRKPRMVPAEGFYTEAERLVFFAVLEGCYTDGLTAEDVDRIIPLSKNGRRDRSKNFVYTCPVCNPAFDGFAIYAGRPVLTKQLGKTSDVSYNTFGQGLDRETRDQLTQGGQACRDAVQGLIQKWVDARFAMLRLTDEETRNLRDELAKMRKKGEKALERFQGEEPGEYFYETYKDWKKGCPICSGASPTMGVK